MILSSVKELWHEVDSKKGPWQSDSWEGHILTFIRRTTFQFESIHVDRLSPFSSSKAKAVVKRVNNHIPDNSDIDECEDLQSTYLFSAESMRRLFRPIYHPTIAVADSIKEIISDPASYNNIKVIIIAHSLVPSTFDSNAMFQDQFLLDEDCAYSYQLRFVKVLRGKDNWSPRCSSVDPNRFDSIRLMRHEDHEHWWM